jgi:hypothetical protein
VCLEIEIYRPEFRASWEKFVRAADNGTLFHRQQFLEYHPPDRFTSHHLLFRRQNRILALLPAVVRKAGGGQTLSSHPGASYGGFVVHSRLGIRDAHLLAKALVAYLREEKFQRVELTPPPLFYSAHPNNYIDFALLKHGFGYLRRELTSVVPLPDMSGDVLSSFKNEARTATRKARKSGVVVRESDDYQGFYHILRNNLRMRHDVTPTHTPEELLRLKALLPEEIRLFSAYLRGEQIAGVVLFLCNPRVMLAFYISHRQEYQKYRSVNLLFHEIMDRGRQRGFRYLDFGTFTLNMEPNWGLGKFKETFGAKGLFRDTFYLDLSTEVYRGHLR